MEGCAEMASMMGGMPRAAMGVGMALYGLFAVSLIALLIAGTMRLLRVGPAAGNRASPAGELDLRYARGEIDREEYLRSREDVEGGDR